MTIQLNKDDRIYKIIEAKTFGSQRKRFISKIDQNGKITILTYTFDIKDIKDDGTVDSENKRMMMLITDIEEGQFKDIMYINYRIYPEFQILWEKDYSDRSLEDAIDLMNLEDRIKTNIPIRDIIKEIKAIQYKHDKN